MTTTVHHGRWTSAPNLSADAVGSIHDDRQARQLGFKGALIGGSVLLSFIEPLLRDLFGPAWYERGFLKISFVRPVYEADEFRAVIEESDPAATDERLTLIGLEKRDGERATVGYAGLARDATEAPPPWLRAGEPGSAPAPSGADDPLPHVPLGAEPEPRTITVAAAQSASRRAAGGDTSPWYAEASPWGGPIVPSTMMMLINLGNATRAERERQVAGDESGRARAGMNGTFQLLQRGPVFVGQPYTLRSRLAEKGISGRTAFRTSEFDLVDAAGRQIVVARQKVRWFTAPSGQQSVT
jgi:acyl dehydratase